MHDQEEAAALRQIGLRIRTVREAAHLNLHDLARLSGVSAPALSLIENGKRDLRLTTLHRIASALRIQAAALLNEPSAAPPAAAAHDGLGYDLTDYA